MKRAWKWLGAIVLTPIILFVILTVLLYCPPVQNWVVKQVALYVSEQTGMTISIDNVRLAYPLDLELNGFKMIKPTVPPDTVADVKRLVADVQLWPLLKGQVEVDALELNEAKVNTTDFIDALRIKGDIGRLYLQSHGINLSGERMKVNTARIENARIDLALNDSVPEDTTESTANWKIDIDDLRLTKTDFTLHMPGDSMSVHANMENAQAHNAFLGLKDGVYTVKQLDWKGGVLDYDQNFVKPAAKGFDGSHISMTDIHLGIDSLVVATPRISANIRQAAFKEHSGLKVDAFSGRFAMNDRQLSVSQGTLKTHETALSIDYQMDMNAFDDHKPGKFFADVDGQVGRNDMQLFVTDLPRDMMRHWPGKPLGLKGHVEGNLQYLTFKDFHANLPGVADVKATGWVANPTDANRLRANVNMRGRTDDLSMVSALMPADVRKEVALPRGIGINGNFRVNGQQYAGDFTMTEGGGSVKAKGTFDAHTMAYDLKATAQNLHLEHFLPHQGLAPFTGTITAQGHGTDFLDPSSNANINMQMRSFRYAGYDLSGLGGDIRLRNGVLNAKVNSTNSMIGGRFDVNGKLTASRADLHLKGRIDRLDLRQLGIVEQRYVASANADVSVTSDMKSRHSVKGHLGDFFLKENRGKEGMIPLVSGDFDLNAAMSNNSLDARFDGRIDQADLYQLGAVDQPFSMGFGANVDIRSNMDDYYDVKGRVCNLSIVEKNDVYYADDVYLDVFTRRDTTHAVVSSGDFYLNADARGGYQKLMRQGNRLVSLIEKQVKEKHIDQPAIREELPTARIYLESGHDNIFTHFLEQQGYSFNQARMDITSSAEAGLNGTARIGKMVMMEDSITLDSIDLALLSDAERLNYDLRVMNTPANSYPYKAQLKGTLLERGLSAQAVVLDDKDKTGLDVAMLASMEENGIRLNVTSGNAIIGYKNFAVNDGNYIYIGDDKRVSANMKLQADDGAGAYLYTDDSDEQALQNITLSMHKFDLEKVFDVLPFTPQISGILDGDYHIIQTADALTVSSDMTVRNLVYEHSPMGNVGTQLVYMPQEDGSHYVDAIISQDGREVGTLIGTYRSEGEGYLDASFNLAKFPLNYANGFIPDKIVGLRGTGEGELTVKGPLNRLDINGEVYLDSSYLYSEPYGVEMRFANDPVRIQNSRLLFENFEMFANNDSPLNIQGYLDFTNMDRMMMDVRMRARNFLLIDAKENPRSEAFGKAYVNFFGRMQGPLDGLNMRGRVDVLGNTDMTYVLRESALVSDNQLDELVKFTDFNDTTVQKVVTRPDISGFKMDMSINIDEQAHIVCALNADHSNYIDLIGGGELRMTYDPTNDLRLNGRYTLSNGAMKYALPVIPLRTFTIQDGSYIEFTGDPMNPTLNITATERLKTNVSDGTSSGRMVDFDCGVSLTETMSKPGIQFIINAPEDMQMQNELNTKSIEERGKLAVSMLASGMYLGDGNGTTNAAMSGALASFMQSEINNITGSALRSMGLDISANLETSADANGALHTDYTFKFSKRLLNNRLRIIMGGRVSTGGSMEGENGAFFDNFSLEYRLNQRETQYLKLFYQRSSYDWLDGNISQFGAGIMWRRKLEELSDIFRFKSNANLPVMQRRDSSATRTMPMPTERPLRNDSSKTNER